MSHSYAIPVTSARVNVADLHPELARRVHQLCLLLPGLKVVSGARSFAAQKYLYDGYKAGRRGFNLAASPTRMWNGGAGPGRGSRHQIQEPYGVAFAVDLRRGPYSWHRVETMAKQCGLWRTVRSENWHYVGNERGSLTKWIPAPALEGNEVPPAPKMRFSPLAKAIAIARSEVLRRGSRGLSVRLLQSQLVVLGWLSAGEADGIFGRRTEQAVRRMQRGAGIAVDGVVGRLSWAALLDEPKALAPVSAAEGRHLKGHAG